MMSRTTCNVASAALLMLIPLMSLSDCRQEVSAAPFHATAVSGRHFSGRPHPSALSATAARSVPLHLQLRGGASGLATASGDDEEVEGLDDEDAEDEDDEEEEEEEEEDNAPPISQLPVTIIVKTNLGNEIMDQTVMVTAQRTKNIEFLKTTIARQLPGKPPALALDIVHEGRILNDDVLVDELIDEEDDEDRDDGDDDDDSSAEKSIKLTVNIIPPVDHQFAKDLFPKFVREAKRNGDAAVNLSADPKEFIPTEDIVRAYYLNQAAMQRNAALLANPDAPQSAFLRMEMIQEADEMQKALREQVPDDVWEESMVSVTKTHTTEERRGQRYRTGKGGASTNLKAQIQRNLNISWPETLRACFLFIILGFFGGKSTLKRKLLLLCAPMCFVVQARPSKVLLKQLFYMMANPPKFILSLMPVSQQAILSFDENEAFQTLYGRSLEGQGDDEEGDDMEGAEDDDEEIEEADENEDEDEDDEEDADEYDIDEEEEYDDEDEEYDEDE